ncbi:MULTISPECIES: hypothetical protein [Kitasatospora]|nr:MULTISPECIES: hypothetical protein [Kitasatospora]
MIKIEAARAAVEAYVSRFPLGDWEYTEPIETQISDLLADLFHLASAEGLSHELLTDRALMNYLAEQAGEP